MAQLQWLEDFSVPQTFSQSNWSGDTSFFSLDSASFLRLQGPPRSSAASIHRSSAIRHQAQWEIDLTLDFNPSASNYAKIYLWADEKDPQSIQNAVFLKIGGQTEDRVELWGMRQGLTQLIVESPADLVDRNMVELRLRVTADSLQRYRLWADTTAASSPQMSLLGGGHFVSQSPSSYFVLECIHTSTRSDKFFFHSISAQGSEFKDEEPPRILRWRSSPSRRLSLWMDEPIDSLEVHDPALFHLLPMGLGPTSIHYEPNALRIDLNYGEAAYSTSALYLQIGSLPDPLGNELDSIIGPFYWPRLSWGDVQITELLADPDPRKALPHSEGLELCNSLPIPLDLSGSILFCGTDSFSLDSLIIPPASCIWLSDQGTCAFTDSCLEVDWPYSFLPNSSGSVGLINERAELLDLVDYHSDFFDHPVKAAGGWTLQRSRDPGRCPVEQQWTEAQEPIGGSPGIWNAHIADSDHVFPSGRLLKGHGLLGNQRLLLHLSRPFMRSDSIKLMILGRSIRPENTIVDLEPTLVFQLPLGWHSGDTVHISGMIESCAGKEVLDTAWILESPAEPSEQQWTIEEVLYEPTAQQEEYVVLRYTASGPADLFGLRFCTGTNYPADLRCSDPINDHLLLPPNNAIQLNESGRMNSSNDCVKYSIGLNGFPALSDQGSLLFLLDSNLQLLTETQFSASYHSPLVNTSQGIPLCRNTETAWTSKLASWGAGCGCGASGSYSKESITLSSDCISPNSDGHQDELQIRIRSPFPKTVVQLKVLNEIGIPVGHLLQDEFMGTEHVLTWDGTDGSGERMRVGLYFFWLQLRGERGQTKSRYKAFSVCQ